MTIYYIICYITKNLNKFYYNFKENYNNLLFMFIQIEKSQKIFSEAFSQVSRF